MAGDVVLMSLEGRAVFGLWRTAFAPGRYWGGGLRHSWEGDAWQEYDGKTANLPDTNPRQLGAVKYPPTVDLGRDKSDGWKIRKGGGWIRMGLA